MSDAVILSGGVARGAFGAGALRVLLRDTPDLSIRTIVATSSGSLNGAYLASAIRGGQGRMAGIELEDIWRVRATALGVFDPSFRGLVLRSEIRPRQTGRHPIELRVILTATAGDVVTDETGRRATTFERVRHFDGRTFDDASALEEMFRVVTASCAFPGAYLPVTLTDPNGAEVPCYDGGLVENSPVKHAIEDPTVTRVFVIVPFPSVYAASPSDRHGLALALHLVDVLVNERLYRDLKEAREVNRALAALGAALPGDARAAALRALRWGGRRPIEVVEIRPPEALEGGAFDGLFSQALREKHIEAGRAAAQAWTDAARA